MKYLDNKTIDCGDKQRENQGSRMLRGRSFMNKTVCSRNDAGAITKSGPDTSLALDQDRSRKIEDQDCEK